MRRTLRRGHATIVRVENTYCECVFVALGIQNAMPMRHIVICRLCGCTIFLHIVS